MAHIGVERRRSPRVTPAQEYRLSLEISIPVQVLDISLSGVLLASRSELTVGDRAELRATVGTKSVATIIEIRRVSVDTAPTRGGARYRAGAVFAPMSADQRVVLEQLLGTEPT